MNFDNFQPEVVSDVVFGFLVEPTGMDVRVNLVIPGQTTLDIDDCLTL